MDLDELAKFDRPLAVIMGSEGKGVSSSLRNNSDMSVTIKMTGTAESLNVAATSAIILYKLQ